jgi:hypothetical protein
MTVMMGVGIAEWVNTGLMAGGGSEEAFECGAGVRD